jgi:NAD(P)-dependent dehydrogenase (short-subunit alcohol dehydrogenase family)
MTASTPAPGRLEGKVALITGVASGMGRQAALTFAREGACVIGCDLNAAAGLETASRVHGDGGQMLFMQADASREPEVAALVQRGVERFSRLDVLYNNAGIGPPTDGVATEVAVDVFEWVMRVNVTGPFLCCKHAIPHLIKNGGGSIINIASTGGLVGGEVIPITAYGTSKAAVIGLTRQLAVQFARHRIRVNAVCPGPISTPILDPFFADPEVKRQFAARVPIGRMGEPDDVVSLCVYLASDESSFMTGSILVIDGGITAR